MVIGFIVVRAGKNSLCWLLLPMLLWFGESAFTNQTFLKKLFTMLHGSHQVFPVTIIAAWLLIERRKPTEIKPPLEFEGLLLIAFLSFLMISFLLTLEAYGMTEWTINMGVNHLGYGTYFIFYRIFLRYDNERIFHFLDTLVLINTFFMFLYISSAMGIVSVYGGAYIAARGQAAAAIYPFFSAFVVCYLSSKERLTFMEVCFLLFNIIGFVFYNVRSSLVYAILIPILGNIIMNTHFKKRTTRFQKLLASFALVLIAWIMLVTVFQHQYQLTVKKWGAIKEAGGVSEVASYDVRKEGVTKAIAYSLQEDPIFGFGLISQSIVRNMNIDKLWPLYNYLRFPDNAWVSAILTYGLLGTGLFVLVLTTFLLLGIKSFRKTKYPADSTLALTASFFLAWQVSNTFFSWTFINEPATAFWFVPLIPIAAMRSKQAAAVNYAPAYA